MHEKKNFSKRTISIHNFLFIKLCSGGEFTTYVGPGFTTYAAVALNRYSKNDLSNQVEKMQKIATQVSDFLKKLSNDESLINLNLVNFSREKTLCNSIISNEDQTFKKAAQPYSNHFVIFFY